jgi:competence protein ComEA
MARRLALLAIALLAVGARPLRSWLERPPSRPPCAPEGRGIPPRHWIGCASDPGPPRELAADERLALGLPVDANAAGARELAFVPGLSRRVAADLVADRDRNGPFASATDLLRVRGIGPKRLALAAPHLAFEAPRPRSASP